MEALMALLAVLASLVIVLLVPTFTYYYWMKMEAKKDWAFTVDDNNRLKVSLVVSTYNEVSVIEKKLEDIQKIDYPEDKLQVIVVDSGSNDGTLDACKGWLKKNDSLFPVELVSEEKRLGKSHALNTALEYANGEIIATSDADSFWEPDALHNAVSFFANPSVGAVTGREELVNLKRNVLTLSEGIYRNFYYVLRLGESKIDSTFIFQGELSLYRRSAFEEFEHRAGYSDDIGTVVGIISRGYRCIFTPEAVFHDVAPYSMNGRLMLKSRRAQHLIAGTLQALSLKFGGKLHLSSAILLFNFYLHVVSPLLLLCTGFVFALTMVLYFQNLWYLLLLSIPLLIFRKSRIFLASYLTSNLALVIGLVRHVTSKREVTWGKIGEMRSK